MSGVPGPVPGVSVRAGERAACRSQGQLALAYALERQQLVCQTAQPVGSAAQNHDFKAVVAVEVDVRRGDDLGVSFVLDVQQAVGKVGLVMAVDVGQHADGGTGLEFGFSQPVAHEVTDGLGAGPAGLAEECLKTGQQLGLHRDAEPYRTRFFVVVLSVTHPAIVTPAVLPVKRGED